MAPTVIPTWKSPQVPDRTIPLSAPKSPPVAGASPTKNETTSENQSGDTGDQNQRKKSKHPRADTP